MTPNAKPSRNFLDDFGAIFGVPDFADRYHPDPNAAQLLERGVRWPGCHDGAPAPTGAALGLLELAARARGWRAAR
jgi:hypothetical protein